MNLNKQASKQEQAKWGKRETEKEKEEAMMGTAARLAEEETKKSKFKIHEHAYTEKEKSSALNLFQ